MNENWINLKATLIREDRTRRWIAPDYGDEYREKDDVVQTQIRIGKVYSRSGTSLSMTTPLLLASDPIPCSTPVLPIEVYFTTQDDVDVVDFDIHFIVSFVHS